MMMMMIMLLAKLCGLQTGMNLVVRIMCPPYTVRQGLLTAWTLPTKLQLGCKLKACESPECLCQIRYQWRNSPLLQWTVRAESVEWMHIIILQMLICTQVYADADAHTDTCTRSTNTVFPTTLHKHGHTSSLRQTQSTAAWSVRGGVQLVTIKCGEYKCLYCYSSNHVHLVPLTTAHT